jgi:hypothetical protein
MIFNDLLLYENKMTKQDEANFPPTSGTKIRIFTTLAKAMFRRNFLVNFLINFLINCVGDSRLAPVDGRKWENRLNRCDLP